MFIGALAFALLSRPPRAGARDASHWTQVETQTATDDGRCAMIRPTRLRDGARLVMLKENDFMGDTKTEWLVRNRTTWSALATEDFVAAGTSGLLASLT